MNDTTATGDVKIAGTGTVATGKYRNVSIAGSANLAGDIECVDLKVNGSAGGRGTLKAQTVVVNGDMSYDGDIQASVSAKVNGSTHLGGSLNAGSLKVAGSADVQGSLSGNEVVVQGALSVGGDCEVERFVSEGAITVGGLLNAGAVDIQLYAPCSVREIGGEAITVRYGGGNAIRRIVAMFVPIADIRLTAETIEGDDVRLERTTARVVRGNSVVIGPGCDIQLVEYTEAYSAVPDAKVKEARKVGEAPTAAEAAAGSEKPQG